MTVLIANQTNSQIISQTNQLFSQLKIVGI